MTGRLELAGGEPANVVLVGDRAMERSAALVVAQPGGGQPRSMLLGEAVAQLRPADLVEVLCMQERCFGSLGFTVPEELAE